MPTTKIMQAMRSGRKGNFAASRDDLLSLFDDADRRDDRSWRETFGQRRPEKKPEPFIARGEPKSSSGS